MTTDVKKLLLKSCAEITQLLDVHRENKKQLGAVTRSQQMVCSNPQTPITGKIVFPAADVLQSKSHEEIGGLRIAKIEWYENNIYAFGITLSDGTSGKCEGNNKYNNSLALDETTHISKVEVIFNANGNENAIAQIILYDKDKVIKCLGIATWATGRRETFEIDEDERLIGFEADHC
jgi:hypothetical protein